MNLSLKPNPLIALWVPGTLFLIAIIFFASSLKQILNDFYKDMSVPKVTSAFFIISISGFVMGEILDTIRDLFENLLDRIHNFSINWKFFFTGDSEKIDRLEEWYYTYYELDFNISSGIFFLLLGNCCGLIDFPFRGFCGILTILFVIMITGAMTMRKEIVEHTNAN